MPSHSLEPARAIVFVDGPNLYHALKSAGLRANRIDPSKVAKKLVEFRTLVEVRYDIAEIDRAAPARLFRAHRDLLALLEPHPDVRLCRGHMRRVQASNPCARELARYLGNLTLRLPRDVYHELMDIASRHSAVTVHREKGVDVFLACDLVDLARRDAYDVADLVSGDADFTPAVTMARSAGKRVFAASPDIAGRLIRACDVAIRLRREWFDECRN